MIHLALSIAAFLFLLSLAAACIILSWVGVRILLMWRAERASRGPPRTHAQKEWISIACGVLFFIGVLAVARFFGLA